MREQQILTNDAWVDEVKSRVNDIAARAQEFVDLALAAFFAGDKARAEELLDLEEKLDRLEVELEEFAVGILEKSHLSGYYLRFIISALKTNNDLERMADFGADICYATMKLGRMHPEEIPPLLPMMIDRSKNMIRRSLSAMMTEDVGICFEIRGEDVVIDRYAREITDELAERGKQNPEVIARILQIHKVVRTIERLADMSTNVAENIIYLAEGTIVRHKA